MKRIDLIVVIVFYLLHYNEAKSVIGLINRKEFETIGNFCFTIPPSQYGKLHAQAVLHTPNHEFMVIGDSDYKVAVSSCQLLRAKSKYVKPLLEHDKQITAYDLMLNIEPNLNKQNLAAVIARCNGIVNSEYVVEFTNPGGIFTRQFSCEDQGIFEVYLVLLAICLLMVPNFLTTWHILERRQSTNYISVMFFLAAPLFLIHVVLMSIHLFVYSQDGFGLSVFQFLAQLSLGASSTLLAALLLSLSQGLTICSQSMTDTHQVLGIVAGFGISALLYCIYEAISYMQLSPFAQQSSLLGTLHLLCRALAAIACYHWATRSANMQPDIQKKQLLVNVAVLGALWLAYLPVIYWFIGTSSAVTCIVALVPQLACIGYLKLFVSPGKFECLFDQGATVEGYHPYGNLK